MSKRPGRFRGALMATWAALFVLAASSLYAQPVPARITTKIDDAARITLKGNTPFFVKSGADRGAVSNSYPMQRMMLVLKRSEKQEQALQTLVREMHNPASPKYHQWLTPAQFGERFGVAPSDVAQIQAWLQSRGFTVNHVSAGRSAIDFSGTAGQVRDAFSTEIHSYAVGGKTYHANSRDPQIPAALAPVVRGIASLNDARPVSFAKSPGKVLYDPSTHKATPQWTYPVDPQFFLLGPDDFAVQYNLNPVYAAGNKGEGQTIGIISASNIDLSVVKQYRTTFGLSDNLPTVVIDGQDPGQNGALGEAYLDVEAAGSVAPNAKVVLYTSADTNVTSGLLTAAVRAVDDNTASVLSLSYGECEQLLGDAGNQFFSLLWQQAAAQGQTVFVSAGDGGPSGCDNFNWVSESEAGLAVSGFASTPYNVAVGGTDFYYTDYGFPVGEIDTYWSANTSGTPKVSLLKPVPEQPWNDGLGLNYQYPYDHFGIIAGSGGASNCVQGTSNPDGSFATCTAGYAKPSWQSGPGVPDDGARDLPDVSLFAADGINRSAWPVCAAITECNPQFADPNSGAVGVEALGGTSASSPAMAGIMALVNQATKARQGQANFVLYPLAQQMPSVFHDVTIGSNNVRCDETVVTDCTLDSNGDGYYTLQKYAATDGYDQASGLGTLDVNALIANWNKVTFGATTTTLTVSPSSFMHGSDTTVTVTVSAEAGTPSGTVALVADSTLPGNASQGTLTLDETGKATGTLNFLPGGSYNLVAQYGGDGTFAGSKSAPVALTVAPEDSKPGLSGSYQDMLGGGGSVEDGGTYATGDNYFFTPEVLGASGNGVPTGSITIQDGDVVLTTLNLNAAGVATWNTGALGVGSHALTVVYSGDASFKAGTSPAIHVTVNQGQPRVLLANRFGGEIDAYTGQSFQIPVFVESFGVAPTGTVDISVGGQTQTVALTSITAPPNYLKVLGATRAGIGVATFTGLAAGVYPVTATYSGDTNYAAANAFDGTRLYVDAAPTGLAATKTTLSLSSSNTDPDSVIVLNAKVTVPTDASAIPQGIVYFYEGAAQLGAAFLDATGQVTLYLNGNSFLEGPGELTAQYLGDDFALAPSTSDPVAINANGGDFSITANTQTVAITSGQTGTTVLQLGSMQGMTGSANMTCSTSSSYLTCSFNPASVALSTTANASTTLTINTQTKAPTSAALRKGLSPLGGWTATGGLALAGLLFVGFRRRRRVLAALAVMALGAMLGLGLTSCGGDSGSKPVPPPPTQTVNAPPGNYAVTVTGTVGGVVHNLQVQIVVQ